MGDLTFCWRMRLRWSSHSWSLGLSERASVPCKHNSKYIHFNARMETERYTWWQKSCRCLEKISSINPRNLNVLYMDKIDKILEACLILDVSRENLPLYWPLWVSCLKAKLLHHTSQDLEEALWRLSGKVCLYTFACYSCIKTWQSGSLVTANEQGVEWLRGHVHLSTNVLPSSLQTPGVAARNDVTSLVLSHGDTGKAGGDVRLNLNVPVLADWWT